MEYKTILVESKEGYAQITLNRPDKLNALNAEMLSELHGALTGLQNNSAVHALVLTGSGAKAFAAGADIAELHSQNGATGRAFAERGQMVFNLLEYFGRPVIAAVNGFALGGGCELALACHIRFASDNAKFGQPEVNLGIIPGYGGTQRLPRLVGKAKATELILSGDVISAGDAEKIGLVNSVHAPEDLMEHTTQFVRKLLTKSQPALRHALACINAHYELSPARSMEFEADKFAVTCATKDFKEGTKAFLEKRSPSFTNS